MLSMKWKFYVSGKILRLTMTYSCIVNNMAWFEEI